MTAQREVSGEDDAVRAAAACFVCMGAGVSAPLRSAPVERDMRRAIPVDRLAAGRP
jgi:hypothetical protein